MSESTTASSFAEELKAKHAADHAHQPTVEEVPDEDIVSHKAGSEAAVSEDKPSWVEPISVKSAGKQKEQAQPKAIDTQSHELFPELGGPKPKPATGVAPIWGAKSNTNGKTNGASTNGTPRPSAPASGVTTPIGHGPPALSIPGRNVETMYLSPDDMLARTELKRPVQDVIKDLNRKSRAQVSMATQGNGKLRFEATGPTEVAQAALKDLIRQIGAKVGPSQFRKANPRTFANLYVATPQNHHPGISACSHHWKGWRDHQRDPGEEWCPHPAPQGRRRSTTH